MNKKEEVFMLRICMLAVLLVLASPAQAAEVEGVVLAEELDAGGSTLLLNGAGVRTKFFFDIYVGALYLSEKTGQAAKVLQHPSPARVSMSILYKEVEAEKLTHGWQEGFEKNQSSVGMKALESRLHAFNAMFTDLHRGDVLLFDFLPDGSTHISIKGDEKGVIRGADFQRALMAVWLGKKPADSDLKEGMLGH